MNIRSWQIQAWPTVSLILVALVALATATNDYEPRVRRAPFSSWAGKRSGEAPELNQLIRDLREALLANGYHPEEEISHLTTSSEEKRAPFSAWAGKRAPFSSWAGKRAPFSSWAGKRAPFSHWAGKRGSSEENDIVTVVGDRVRVKRSSEEDDEEQRHRRSASFSSWGGKRSGTKRVARKADPKTLRRPARSTFSAWGGK